MAGRHERTRWLLTKKGVSDMTTIRIEGMSCQHCVAAVTEALGSIEGIADVRVDLEAKEATFEETIPVDPALIREKVEDEGYKVV